MALWGMPLLLINMGGEMIYILDQRLHAQNVPVEKSFKVLDDVVRTMFNPKFVAELFKPQDIYSPASMRQVFDRLAHSSIMRLSEASMDKLYDLMMMGFKYQILCVSNPQEVVFVTLNHLQSIRGIVRSEAVIAIIDDTIRQVKETYGRFSLGDFCQLRHVLVTFFQDRHVKVSLFLQENLQTSEGHFRVAWGGPTPPRSEATRPGEIRYFGALGEETHKSHVAVACQAEATAPMPPQTMESYTCTLGHNMYLKDRQRGSAPPDREYASGGSTQAPPAPAAAAAAEKPPTVTAKSAMAELNMLAELMGDIAESVAKESKDDGFRLNIFNDTAIPDGGGGQEVKSDKVKFDSKHSNKDLKQIASSMDLGGAEAPGGGGEEDDLLD